MMHQCQGFVRWGGLIGLVGMLALAGCSTKSTIATTAGAEPVPAVPKMKAESGTAGAVKPRETESAQQSSGGQGGSQNQPLRDFSKTPREERVASPSPMVVAQADQQETAARKLRENARREMGDIYFAFDKWALSGEGKKNLTQNAEMMKQDPTVPILIEGYCDERGSREYNLVLGDKRAKETQQYFLALGIRNPIKIISYGKERQVCAGHDESCYWKNRRAHLLMEDGK